MDSDITIREARPEDLDLIAGVEQSCFPAAEAAPREEFAKRIRSYGNHFRLVFLGGRLVSFADGFVTDEPDLTDEMYENAQMHDENGAWQMIFGVNTLPPYRGRGLAGMAIRALIESAQEEGRKGLVLTCKEEKIHYYEQFGFINEGVSSSVHGGAVWYQMRLPFSFILKGNIIYSRTQTELETVPDGYLVCDRGVSGGVFTEVPARFRDLPVYDQGDAMIIPGLVDLHLHAPQYSYRGTGMDLELIEWLSRYTYPEEAKFADPDYAHKVYARFVRDLRRSATTRAVIFGTMHVPATLILMDHLERSGLVTLAGKVSMDRNSPDFLREGSAQEAERNVRSWLAQVKSRGYCRTMPILTPRFTPSCTDELMRRLGEVQRDTGIGVQSHLSENPREVEWVHELCPDAAFYGETYSRVGLFGGDVPTVMAHCVYSTDEEVRLMRERGVYIAHCPQSNINVASGIAPVRRYLDLGMHVGLGTDIAGGANLSMMRAVTDAVGVSKLRWRCVDSSLKPLRFEEAFYMATCGGGSFFGKAGSFEEGYVFDALVIEEDEQDFHRHTLRDRLEQYFYLENGQLRGKYVNGRRIRL